MLEVKALCEGFGLEARGVDIPRLDDAAFAELETAFFRGQVLVLREQQLTPDEFVRFSRRFGPPEPHVIDQFHHPADANILILSNRQTNGKPVGLADAAGLLTDPPLACARMKQLLEVHGCA